MLEEKTSKVITGRERERKRQVDTVANVKMRQDLKARRGGRDKGGIKTLKSENCWRKKKTEL